MDIQRQKQLIPAELSVTIQRLIFGRSLMALPEPIRPSGLKTGKATAADTDALQVSRTRLPSLRSCARRPQHGDWDFALRLSRSRTRGISLHRIRAFGFVQD